MSETTDYTTFQHRVDRLLEAIELAEEDGITLLVYSPQVVLGTYEGNYSITAKATTPEGYKLSTEVWEKPV